MHPALDTVSRTLTAVIFELGQVQSAESLFVTVPNTDVNASALHIL